MADHWWWRPGVRPGRRLLVWHILLGDHPEVRDLVRQCQDKLAGLDGLDLIPPEWLHMTTQIVGFADEIGREEIEAMISAAAERLANIDPVQVEVGKVWFHPEAVMLTARPARVLDPVRLAIRDAVAATVSRHQLADQPDWTPHISVAYSNATGLAAPIITALGNPPRPRPMTVSQVHLVTQERAGHLYRWDGLAPVELGRTRRVHMSECE
ncbi:MAG TPA: 2'-5' RNA ligase family protein [Streptosporangiaceae bacterium]|jgi:2'-5' RNA ligase|nr:2'-5' RNA ligase family protein [Streptosporangiaceae bacterium]